MSRIRVEENDEDSRAVILKTSVYVLGKRFIDDNDFDFSVDKGLDRDKMMETYKLTLRGQMEHGLLVIKFRHTLRIYLQWKELPQEIA